MKKKKVEGTKVQQPILSEQQKMQMFVKEYEQLCEKHGYMINVNPAFKARDDGTWSVVLQTGVGKIKPTQRGQNVRA